MRKVRDSLHELGRLLIPWLGLSKDYGIYVYMGSGSAGNGKGDHIMVMPAYNITDNDMDIIVSRVGKLIDDFFNEYHCSSKQLSSD